MRRSFRFRSWQVGGSAIVVAASALALVACASGAPTSSNAGDAPLAGDPVVSAAPHTSTPTAAPVTKPSTSAPTPSATSKKTPVKANSDAKTGCTVGAKLVPTCGVLWGAAAGGFTNTPRDQALRQWEQTSGRTTAIYHTYHSGDQLFPTAAEIAVAHQKGNPRLLLLNWKVADGSTWAKVAAGAEDKRIDREAAYLKKTFTDRFFLVLHHEPEDNVNQAKGSGMTAANFAAMFRHVILRLRADGVKNAVSVVVYMNYEKWENTSWWPQLYPGDDVVDWIGTDTYLNADPGGFHNGDFTSMVNRTTKGGKFPGFYSWATSKHPSKPIMLAEWGVYGNAADKAGIFNTVLPELAKHPAIKAMVYFDTPKDQGGRDIRINSSASSTAAFRKVAAGSIFKVSVPAP